MWPPGIKSLTDEMLGFIWSVETMSYTNDKSFSDQGISCFMFSANHEDYSMSCEMCTASMYVNPI